MSGETPYDLAIAYLIASLVFLLISDLAGGTSGLGPMIGTAAMSISLAMMFVAAIILIYGVLTNS